MSHRAITPVAEKYQPGCTILLGVVACSVQVQKYLPFFTPANDTNKTERKK
jgi:hypothetical protein